MVPSNYEVLIWHLKEAREWLDDLIKDLDERGRQENEEYWRQRIHQVYHHMNSGWNAREESEEYWKNQTDEAFYRYRMFPTDLVELLEPVPSEE